MKDLDSTTKPLRHFIDETIPQIYDEGKNDPQ